MTWLLIYVFFISLYDLRTRRIPNWCTPPIFIVGMIAHFPGQFDIWLASFALLSAWASNWMGAGDVKLWVAVLWALPVEYSQHVLPFMFASFLLTGLAQIIWRTTTEQTPTDTLTPAAWRTLPFILLCWYVH